MKWLRAVKASLLLVLFVLTTTLLSACVFREQDTVVGAGAPDAAAEDTTTTVPLDVAPSVPPIEPLETQLDNTNLRDGGLGSLCWARWEVSRHIVRASVQEDSPSGLEAASLAIDQLRDQLPAVATELERAMGTVPMGLTPFVEKFQAEVIAAQQPSPAAGGVREELEELGAQFDFEAYPAAVQYDELSQQHSGCLRP